MVCKRLSRGEDNKHNNKLSSLPLISIIGDGMIEIEEVSTQEIVKRVGDSVTINVKLRNDGNTTGHVKLKTYVYDWYGDFWILLDENIFGTDVTVNPGSTVTKSYSFKPTHAGFLTVKAEISGDSSDVMEKDFDMTFQVPKVDWYGGWDVILKSGNCVNTSGEWDIPSECEKGAFHYGETIYILYKQKYFGNRGDARALLTWVREVSKDVVQLKWQGVLTFKALQEGYYWIWCAGYWWLSNYPKGTYVAIVTVDMLPVENYGWNYLSKGIAIY